MMRSESYDGATWSLALWFRLVHKVFLAQGTHVNSFFIHGNPELHYNTLQLLCHITVRKYEHLPPLDTVGHKENLSMVIRIY